MIQVEFTGAPVGDEIPAGALEAFAGEIREELGDLRCSQSGGSPIVWLEADDQGDLIFEIHARCDEVAREVWRRLDVATAEAEPGR
jgi:hypothetical protein